MRPGHRALRRLRSPPRGGYATGSSHSSVAIGDLNGDGKPDLATANYADPGTVSVLLSRGDGSFRAKRDYATGRGSGSVAIGDLNGDGKPDLVTANYDANTVSVLLNRGDGSFAAQARLRNRTAGPGSVAIGDLNGDGKPDLATANSRRGTASPCFSTGATAASRRKRDYATGADAPLASRSAT